MRILIALSFLLVLPASVFALQINEIMYNPIGSEDYDEWVELYNEENSAVDLTGWKICGKDLLAGYIEKGSTQAIRDNTMVVQAGGYVLVTDGGSGSTVLDDFKVAGDAILVRTSLSSICGRLTNSGKSINIGNDGDPDHDVAVYQDSADEGFSLEMDAAGGFVQSSAAGGTPGYKNSVIQNTPQQTENLDPTNEGSAVTQTNTVETSLNVPKDVYINIINHTKTGNNLETFVELRNRFGSVKSIELYSYVYRGSELANENSWQPNSQFVVLSPNERRIILLENILKPDASGDYILKARSKVGNETWDSQIPLALEIGDSSGSPSGYFTLDRKSLEETSLWDVISAFIGNITGFLVSFINFK